MVATVDQHGKDDSGGHATKADQPKEKRRKAGQNEHSIREGHEVRARPVKNFRDVGDVKNAPLTCEQKSNLRVKRRDPWPRANAPSKAVADPKLEGQDAEKIANVSWSGSWAGGATISPSELKSLTRNSAAARCGSGGRIHQFL